VLEEARRRFYETNDQELPGDLRNAVYSTVMSHGGEKEYEELLKRMRAAQLHEEKLRCLYSLGRVKNAELLQRTLQLTISDEVKSQDCALIISNLNSNPLAREITWNFFKSNFAKFMSMYNVKGNFLLYTLLGTVISAFGSEEKVKEIEDFFEKNPISGAERTIQQSIEKVRQKAEWINRDGDLILSWLKRNFS
jgi:aminopeptidase N